MSGVERSLRTGSRTVDAIRYWEPRRVIYNAVLGLVVLGWGAGTWPHFRPAIAPDSLVELGILAVCANLCYSAAYVVEISAQRSPWRGAWRVNRWVLWLAGTVLSVVLTSYWIADEIYPSIL